jgi:hypothetical protein
MRGFNYCIEVRAESRQGFDTVAAQPTQPERLENQYPFAPSPSIRLFKSAHPE